eukprot:203414_1
MEDSKEEKIESVEHLSKELAALLIDAGKNWYGSGGWLPGPARLRKWRQAIVNNFSTDITYKDSVKELAELIQTDPSVKLLVNQMLDQEKALNPILGNIANVRMMLFGINYLIQQPIIYYDKDLVGIPLAAWFTGLDATLAGQTLFRYPKWNDAISVVLKTYHDYLDSQDSWPIKDNSWIDRGQKSWAPLDKKKGEPGLDLWKLPSEKYPYWKSWNDFFTRDINRQYRKIAGKGNPNIITSPNEGCEFRWRYNVQKRDVFWLKNMPYSLADIFGNELSEYAEIFKGGYVWQSFLNPFNYHNWWSPVSGKIKKKKKIPGAYYSKLVLPDFCGTTTASCPYLTHVNARGIVIIDTAGYAGIGLVCCIPIGMCECSTICWDDKIIKDAPIKKGEKLGRFEFGGSTFVVIFEDVSKYNKILTFMADHAVYDKSNIFPMDAPAPSPSGKATSIDIKVGMKIAVISD